MDKNLRLIIDFDSTFVTCETLEVMADIKADADPNLANKIKNITDAAMNGDLDFGQALSQRLELLNFNRADLQKVVVQIAQMITPSFERNKSFFKEYGQQIFIASGGFTEIIAPIVQEYGINIENVFANTFVFSADGRIIGVDTNNPFSMAGGKVKWLASKAKTNEIYYVIGDGFTDAEMRIAGYAHKFFAFAENVSRQKALNAADTIINSFDEFLYENNLPMALSYPKSRIKVLILENIDAAANELFTREGYPVEIIAGSLDEDELCEKIKDVSILCIRSKTNVTKRVLESANRLLSIGAFCIGTNQIDLEAATQAGVVVFNAPFSNTRSVVEMSIGLMINLMRGIPAKDRKMHNGIWEKTAKHSNEVRGKTLGIIGYGNIGTQLSVLAEALGMHVVFYDVLQKLSLGNAVACASLDELLAIADVVSLHVDGRKENTNIMGATEFNKMKPGAVFINLARGHLVDLPALKQALTSGRLRGAAIDVFPTEPKKNVDKFESELCGIENLVLTPHIGGSTTEAQFNIANFVPGKIIDYINTGNTFLSVNLPNLQLPAQNNKHRFMHLHSNEPGVLAQINTILAKYNANIAGQYLKTSEKVGYVITDVDAQHHPDIEKELKAIKGTIRFRVLY